MKNTVVVIFAPTASGKTALTRELFSPKGSHFFCSGEIISADSQAVYKGMDIGTAKPEIWLQKEIPHHLINILTPEQQFNVSDFVDYADEKCLNILQRGRLPVVCGGTGFYIRNFLYGVPPTPQSDETLRNKLKERIKVEGNRILYEELKNADPESAAKIHINDGYRICRALEVYYLSGKTRTSFQIEQKIRDKFNFVFIVLQPQREVLYERIRCRVDLMIKNGLEKEIQTLIAAGFSKESPGLKAIGYREWFEYKNRDEIIEQIKHHSCKYAKKQYTYIRDIPGSTIINFNASEENYQEIKEILRNSL